MLILKSEFILFSLTAICLTMSGEVLQLSFWFSFVVLLIVALLLLCLVVVSVKALTLISSVAHRLWSCVFASESESKSESEKQPLTSDESNVYLLKEE